VVAGLTGAIFWLVAARLYPSTAVGNASALFTAVLFVNFLSNLGIPVLVARFGDEDRVDYDVLFTIALVVSAAGSAVAAVGYLLVVDAPSVEVLRRWGFGPAALVFAVLVIGASIAVLVDVRLMVARRWGAMLVRVAAVGLLRLPLLWFDWGVDEAVWLFLISMIPPAASGFVGLAALRRLESTRYRLRPRPRALDVAVRYAGVNYLATLAADGVRFALPVLVLVNVTPTANASFYVAWSVTMIAFLVPATIGQVLLVEAPRSDDRWAHARTAALLAGGLMALAAALVWLGTDLLVSLYGPGYQEGADILPRLMLAGVPWSVTSVALADARVRHDHVVTLAITVVLAASIIGPAVALVPSGGIATAADVWLSGHVIASIVAAVLMLRARGRDRSGELRSAARA
jgi:O-antigen/teichoic acid export membrane protein